MNYSDENYERAVNGGGLDAERTEDMYAELGRELWNEAHQDIKFDHGLRCDDLSRRIAVESGQAKEHAPGIIEYKTPHFYLDRQGEEHVARIGDRWNAEICL